MGNQVHSIYSLITYPGPPVIWVENLPLALERHGVDGQIKSATDNISVVPR